MRVLLIEDEQGLVLTLTDRLRSEGFEVDVATDGTVSETREPFNLGLPIGTVPLGVAVVSK